MKKLALLSLGLLLASGMISYSTSKADPKNVTKATKQGNGNVVYLASEGDLNSYLANGNVVVDFYADWCGPCKKLGPVIDEIAPEFPNVYFVKVNVNSFSSLSTQYGVRSIPTLLFFKDGNKVKQISGFKNKQELTAILNDLY